jgi:hypothetical protein
VASFAQQELKSGESRSKLQKMAEIAEGSIGRLLASSEAKPGGAAESYLAAVRAGTTSRLAYALRQPAYQARGTFTEMLDELLDRLRAELHERSEKRGGEAKASKLIVALAQVLAAREMAQGNVNPQLLTAVLSEDLAEAG